MQVYIGIDWSKDKHHILFMNEHGAGVAEIEVSHTPGGFARFDTLRERLGVPAEDCLVGIETHHNLFVDYLVCHDYQQLYVLPPFQVNRSRGRYGASGAASDQTDAHLIADMLRTDRGRLIPWQPNSLLIQQLAAKVSLERYLTRSVVQATNRLRTVLWRYFPNAAHVFSKLDAQVALEFICAYPTPAQAQALPFEAFRSFAKQHRYPNPRKLPERYARLQKPQPQASRATVQAFQGESVRLAKLALYLVRERSAVRKEISQLFAQHPDAPIFSSLPGAGDTLAPALLSKFGDDRRRYPSAQLLQSMAGTCPYTKQSGKRKAVLFRRACDREFRSIAQQWARSSLDQSVWANTYFQQLRPRCRSLSHAYRCVANRWLAIAWRLWQDRVPYDEVYHLRQHAQRVQLR
jgi:transposase